MGKRLQTIREKLGIPSGKALLYFIAAQIIFNTIFDIIWYWVSKGFTVPYVREVGFLVVFVAGLLAVAWYLPQLVSQNVLPKSSGRPRRTVGPSRLEHDSVLWEDAGNYASGGLIVTGPLCPKDYTPLGTRTADDFDVDTHEDDYISAHHQKLFCPECKREYTLGTAAKFVRDSRNEVRSRFEGKRRRYQEN